MGHPVCGWVRESGRVRETAVVRARMVPEVAEADTHVVMQRAGNGHRYAQAHDAVSESEGVDVAVAEKQ
jgi:hypothetical protein